MVKPRDTRKERTRAGAPRRTRTTAESPPGQAQASDQGRLPSLIFVCLVCFGVLISGALGGGRAQAAEVGATNALPIPSGEAMLARVRPGHPRLLASSNEFVRLRERAGTDGRLQAWQRKLRDEAEGLLGQAPSRYEIPDGLRLLSVSRRVLHRTQLLGLLHRLDGGRRWRDRLWEELSAAAAFPDWNPRHFLDTAEMTHAFALGYDWLFDAWSAGQREVLRAAMVEKGLKPALEVHRKKAGWSRARHNWNQVCNGGIGMGALALAEVEPALAGELLPAVLLSVQLPMAEFAPDGAWAEGPGYWNYATTYNVVLLAALETALGTDFGLGALPGFAEAGSFPLYLMGPLDRTFNYADGGDGAIRAPHLFWMARRFQRPAYAAYQARVASPEPLDLLWYDAGLGAAVNPLPLDKHFRGADIMTFRSAWDDRQAFFVGFKAGDNKANHSHLDLGSFVLDALGYRWAMDLGAENYNLPGYFGGARWTYYRLRAEGQNTLVLNPGPGPDQDPKAAARVERFESTPARAVAVVDLTPAYARHARSVRRGVALLDRTRLMVQDEVRADAPVDAWWFMHTPARIRLSEDGRSAELQQGEAVMRAKLLSPAGARFEDRPATPLPGTPGPEGQNPNRNVRKLTVHVPGARELRLTVMLSPEAQAAGSPPMVRGLDEWPEKGP